MKIFLYLDNDTLSNVELVCRRWYYLTNTIELWFYKCKEMLLKEKLSKKQMLLFYECIIDNEDLNLKYVFDEITEYLSEIKHLKQQSRLRQLSASNILNKKLFYIQYF